MKYRLVKKIHASGYVQWNIERKVLFWWEYVCGYFDEKKAIYTLGQLRGGVPLERKVVMPL